MKKISDSEMLDKTIEYFESYYGAEYNQTMRSAVKEFLQQYPSDVYKPIIREVRRTFSHSLRCAPGIKELEDAVKMLPKEQQLTNGQLSKKVDKRLRLPISEIPKHYLPPNTEGMSDDDIFDYYMEKYQREEREALEAAQKFKQNANTEHDGLGIF